MRIILAVALLLACLPARAAEMSPAEHVTRLQAALQEVIAQRDAAQARAANLAGDIAAALLQLQLRDVPPKMEQQRGGAPDTSR